MAARRAPLLAFVLVPLILVACGQSSEEQLKKATDDLVVASAASSLAESIVHDGMEEQLRVTADYILTVRSVSWSKSHKGNELEDEALKLASTCAACSDLIRLELTQRY